MFRSLYNWTMSLAAHPHALLALGFIAFIESSVFPIPPDILIIPMVLAARDQAWKIALIATVASVLGGMFGYGIGAFLFESIGQPIIEFYGKVEYLEDFRTRYNDWGAWIVFIAGVTPFPYKVITIASGFFELNFTVFSISSFGARGLRFFLVAGLLWYFGQPIRIFIEKYLNILATIFCILLIGGFVALKYLI
ncbi:cytochrome B561 [Kiloniella litopenaei]|uniref:Cytochrome B561 n=1 Tax=Kiloniella litopenaei TaxID=1549748 RepID=A0A0M2R7F5_9PROT|nr:YqaA family protein [Kiloniella litopenaei]KKJ77817.1 cytochrome B561 [Kiloniella litopenaei]